MTNLLNLNISTQSATKVDRQYFVNGNPVDYPSVTQIVCGFGGDFVTEHMIRGSEVHSLLANFLSTGQLEKSEDELTNTKLNALVISIRDLFKAHPVAVGEGKSIEVSRAGTLERDGITHDYCGTADLILQNAKGESVVVEFKTGKSASWHYDQVVANMLLHDATEGFLLYEDGIGKVGRESVGFVQSAHEFFNKLDANKKGLLKKGKIKEDMQEFKEELDVLAVLLREQKELEIRVKNLKDYILQGNPQKGFETESVAVYYKKPYISKTLKTEAKELLTEAYPEYFEDKEVAESYSFKLKIAKKTQEE